MFTELIKKRIIAYLIDCVIISIPLYLLIIIYWDYILTVSPNQLSNFGYFLQIVSAVFYFFISEMIFGKTFGKKLLKLKVEQTEANNKFFSFFIRTISRLIPLDLITFIFLENQVLHDKLSKTKVVENI